MQRKCRSSQDLILPRKLVKTSKVYSGFVETHHNKEFVWVFEFFKSFVLVLLIGLLSSFSVFWLLLHTLFRTVTASSCPSLHHTCHHFFVELSSSLFISSSLFFILMLLVMLCSSNKSHRIFNFWFAMVKHGKG